MKYGFPALVALLLASGAMADQVAELNEAELNAIDKDNDGFLSKDEFNAFSDYAFQAMDENRDGTLTAAETRPHLEIKHFSAMDKNGDNLVSPGEFSDQMSQDFVSADRNQNGKLD